MPTYFLDSSALVKRYREEEGTAFVLKLLESSNRLIIARLAQVEVASAIIRRGRATGTSIAELDLVLAALEREVQEYFEVVELTPPVFSRAVDLARSHALRAADAIQLACALLARSEVPSNDFALVGSDLELNSAAAVEGLPILDPTKA